MRVLDRLRHRRDLHLDPDDHARGGDRRPLADLPPGTADKVRRGGDWLPTRPRR